MLLAVPLRLHKVLVAPRKLYIIYNEKNVVF